MGERRILDSWKDISAYLNRSVMTCHRWEESLGLPIHRLDGTPKARVFAYSDELDRWLAEKLHTGEAVENGARPAARPKGKWTLAVGGSLAFLAAVAAVGRYLYFMPVPAPAQVPSLAVLPFENRTGDPAWDAWKTALPDLLTIDLRQSKFLDVTKTSALFQNSGALAEAEKLSAADLKKMAERAAIDYAVTGSLVRSGEETVIAALVQNARTGEVAGSARSTVTTERDIFAGTDALSKGIKIALNVKPREIRGDIDEPVSKITTSSPEAFKFYSQSYRIQGKLKFDEAISPMLKAVEIDPDFGLAYRVLYHFCQATSRTDDVKRYGQLALRSAGRIDERERGYFLIGFYQDQQPDKKKVIQAFQRLGRNYPYDLAMGGLAGHLMRWEEWDKAIPIWERLAARYPARTSILQPLATCYASQGFIDRAEKLADGYLNDHPSPKREDAPILRARLYLALARNKFDKAHECADRLIAAFPESRSCLSDKGFVYFKQDDLLNAEKMYQQFAADKDERTRMLGFEYLASVSLACGRVEEAKRLIRQAIELAIGLKGYGPDMERPYRYMLAYLERLAGRLPEALKEADLACGNGEYALFAYLQPLYLRALITLEMNRLEDFEKRLKEIKSYLEPDRYIMSTPRLMRVYYNLLGHRELRIDHYDRAIGYFWKALDLLTPLGARAVDEDHTKYFYDLAEAYRRSDQGDAYAMYEKVGLPTVSREFSGDLYARSFYWMGRESERTAHMSYRADAGEWRLKAIGHYRKFLELWKDADPIFPEVEEARQRLARLLSD